MATYQSCISIIDAGEKSSSLLACLFLLPSLAFAWDRGLGFVTSPYSSSLSYKFIVLYLVDLSFNSSCTSTSVLLYNKSFRGASQYCHESQINHIYQLIHLY